jgi:hypothetical protein
MRMGASARPPTRPRAFSSATSRRAATPTAVIGAVVLIRDLTESKKIEEDLAQRVTRLIGLGVELEESAVQ